MSQSYFPSQAKVASPLPMEASTSGEKHLKVEDVQGAYIEQKDRYGALFSLLEFSSRPAES